MALTINANNGASVLSTGTNLLYAQTTTTGVFKFKFYFRITYSIDGGGNTKTIILTQSKNEKGIAVVNLSELFHQMVTPQITTYEKKNVSNSSGTFSNGMLNSIHNLPVNTSTEYHIFSRPEVNDATGIEAFRGLTNEVDIEVYEYYSDTSSGAPQLQGFSTTRTYYVQWGRGERNDGVNFNWTPYNFGVSGPNNNKFLTGNYIKNFNNLPTAKLKASDLMTMAFRIKHTKNTTSDVKKVVFEFYSHETSQISANLLGEFRATNHSSTGGVYASGGVQSTPSTFLFCACGLDQLNELSSSISSYYSGTLPQAVTGGTDAIKSYLMYLEDSSGNRISQKYNFVVQSDDDYNCRYDKTRIAWINKFGCWEYFNFNKVSVDSYKVKHETLNKSTIVSSEFPSDDFGEPLNISYPTGVAHQGLMNWNTQVEDTFKVYTDYLGKEASLMVQDLIMSPMIHTFDSDNNAIALICETKEIKVRARGENQQFTYELKFKYAEPKYRAV